MNRIVDELFYLNSTKYLIAEAVISKGVEVTYEDTFREYADRISEIHVPVIEPLVVTRNGEFDGGDNTYYSPVRIEIDKGIKSCGNVIATAMGEIKKNDVVYLEWYNNWSDISEDADINISDTRVISANGLYVYYKNDFNIMRYNTTTLPWSSEIFYEFRTTPGTTGGVLYLVQDGDTGIAIINGSYTPKPTRPGGSIYYYYLVLFDLSNGNILKELKLSSYASGTRARIFDEYICFQNGIRINLKNGEVEKTITYNRNDTWNNIGAIGEWLTPYCLVAIATAYDELRKCIFVNGKSVIFASNIYERNEESEDMYFYDNKAFFAEKYIYDIGVKKKVNLDIPGNVIMYFQSPIRDKLVLREYKNGKYTYYFLNLSTYEYTRIGEAVDTGSIAFSDKYFIAGNKVFMNGESENTICEVIENSHDEDNPAERYSNAIELGVPNYKYFVQDDERVVLFSREPDVVRWILPKDTDMTDQFLIINIRNAEEKTHTAYLKIFETKVDKDGNEETPEEKQQRIEKEVKQWEKDYITAITGAININISDKQLMAFKIDKENPEERLGKPIAFATEDIPEGQTGKFYVIFT